MENMDIVDGMLIGDNSASTNLPIKNNPTSIENIMSFDIEALIEMQSYDQILDVDGRMDNDDVKSLRDIINANEYFLDARTVIDFISGLLEDMKEDRRLCGQLRDNLRLIYSELELLEAENNLPSPDYMELYSNTICKIQSYLEQHKDTNVKYRIDNFEKLKTEMKYFIYTVDYLGDKLSVDGFDKMERWEEDWREALIKLCNDGDALLYEVLKIQSQEDSLTSSLNDKMKVIRQQNWLQDEILTKTLISIINWDLSSGNNSQQKVETKRIIYLLAESIKHPASTLKNTVFNLFMQLSNSYDNAKNFEVINTIEILIEWLQSGTNTQRLYIATTLRNLAQNCIEIRKLIVEAGGINPLVEMLESETSEHKRLAITTLWILVVNDDNKLLICEGGAAQSLTQLANPGVEDQAASSSIDSLWHYVKDYIYRQCTMILGNNPETDIFYVDGQDPPKRRRINSPRSNV